jgi:hypothetical protein
MSFELKLRFINIKIIGVCVLWTTHNLSNWPCRVPCMRSEILLIKSCVFIEQKLCSLIVIATLTSCIDACSYNNLQLRITVLRRYTRWRLWDKFQILSKILHSNPWDICYTWNHSPYKSCVFYIGHSVFVIESGVLHPARSQNFGCVL